MIGPNNSNRETCGHCTKQIYIGQSSIVCSKCDTILHLNCAKNAVTFRQNIYCSICVDKFDIIRYNPFYLKHDLHDQDDDRFYENESSDYIEMINDMSDILENCRSYSISELNNYTLLNTTSYSSTTDTDNACNRFSTYFYNLDGNKTNFDQLSVNLECIKHKFSVIGLAETNVDPCNKDLYNIDEYSSCYQVRAKNKNNENKSKGSGVALYVHNSHNFTELSNASICTKNLESLFIEITDTNVPITVGVIYRPPGGNYEQFITELTNITAQLPNENTFILGDYNIDLLDTNDVGVQRFEDTVITSGFTPLISVHTHRQSDHCKKTCIDNILTNSTETVDCSGTIENGNKHGHKPVFQISMIKTHVKIKQKSKTTIYYDYSNSNIHDLCSYITRNKSTMDVYAESFSEFNEFYQFAIDKTCKLEVPKTTKRTSAVNPWITQGLINSINRKHELYRSWTKTKTQKSPDGDQVLYEQYKQHRNTLKCAIKLAKSKYYYNKFDKHKCDHKKTWQLINELRGKTRNDQKWSFVIDEERIVCRRAIANKFNDYFCNLANNLNSAISTNIDDGIPVADIPTFEQYLTTPQQASIYLSDTNATEIENIIGEFINGKSSDIPVILVKRTANLISEPLANLYNKCMADGIFPEELKVGKITPIYKKGNTELLENYRPVSTLPIFGKIFEKLIYARLYSFLTAKNILHENQYGFRKGHSTSHALHSSVEFIRQATDNNKHVLGIFIDLSKAFDTLDHRILLNKLNNCGIRGQALDLMKNYLTKRYQYTSISGVKSEKREILFGVPQGSVLGPLLFLLYINDLKNCYKGPFCNFIFYADDTNIFVVGESREEAHLLANKVLCMVNKYMNCNLLHINMNKSCYMHFEPSSDNKEKCARTMPFVSNKNLNQMIYINNSPIRKVKETRFLGVIIDDKLNWSAHIDHVAKKLRSAAAVLCRIRDCIPKENYKALYCSLFESYLTYGITVWGGVCKTKMEQIFRIQKHCIRILFGDREKYTMKFQTCARTRPCRWVHNHFEYQLQKLGPSFYCKENTKDLFNINNILTAQNLYNYHSCIEMFKIIKFRLPVSLYAHINISDRKNLLIILPKKHRNMSQFLYKASILWNIAHRKLLTRDHDTSTKLAFVKNSLKALLLQNQRKGNTDWADENFKI